MVLLGLIARELGGDRRAVALAAWGGAFAGLPLALGHALLTSTIDLPLTLGVVLTALVALRSDPRWWLLAGALAGAATWNRLLVPLLMLGLLLGLAVLGPREPLRTPWPWLGAALAGVLAAPNLVYQATNGWPQVAMGAALSENNADDVRTTLPLILLVAIGPLLVPVWVAGVVQAWRMPRARWVLVWAVVVVGFTLASGAQPHYPVATLEVLYAAGCVPVSVWIGRRAGRRALVVGALVLNAVVSSVIALPVLPVSVLGRTPVPDINIVAADQVGWPEHVGRIAEAYRLADDPGAVIITSNYGEAGAVDRFGPAQGSRRPTAARTTSESWPARPRAPARRCSSGTRGHWSRTCSRRARSWPVSTTARRCPTRSRTPRSRCAPTPCCRGHRSGRASPTSTERPSGAAGDRRGPPSGPVVEDPCEACPGQDEQHAS